MVITRKCNLTVIKCNLLDILRKLRKILQFIQVLHRKVVAMSHSSKIDPDNQKYYDDIAHNIKYYRNKRKYNQEYLAELAGISRTHLSNIENAHTSKGFSYEVLINIAKALGIQPYQLVQPKE